MDELNNPTLSGGELGSEDQQGAQQQTGTEGGQAGEPAAGNADRQKAKQDHAFNAAMAAARRQAERDTEAKIRKQMDDDIAGMRIPNPTKPGTYFSSKKELEEYSGALRQASAEKRAKESGRTVQDVMDEDADREFIRRKRAEDETSKKAAAAKQKVDDFIAADVLDFTEKHPDVDIAKLDSNKSFRRFAGSRYGKEPLADLYEDYVAVVGDVESAAKARQDDRAQRSTGGGSSGAGGTLTAAQRAELNAWNEAFPEMKMTEKQFLER